MFFPWTMALPKFSGKSCERVKTTPSYTTLVVSRRKGLTFGLGASLKKTFAEAPQSRLLRSSTRVLPQELPATQAILPVWPVWPRLLYPSIKWSRWLPNEDDGARGSWNMGKTLPQARGGTLGISWWGCAAGSLEPLTFTRASSAEFCYPILE